MDYQPADLSIRPELNLGSQGKMVLCTFVVRSKGALGDISNQIPSPQPLSLKTRERGFDLKSWSFLRKIFSRAATEGGPYVWVFNL